MPVRVDPIPLARPTTAGTAATPGRLLATLGLLALLGGCTTTIDFNSRPPGATVTYRGQVLGVTPFRAGVHDHFGWFSSYEFTASKPGHRSHTLRFDERTPLDHNNVLPLRMDFELPPQ